ncbi:MAG: MoaD/ThiS family protein [Bacteroidota bacterium]
MSNEKIKLLLFGQLVEIVGSKELIFEGYTDTASLIAELHKRFPALVQSKYVMAVNQEMITDNTSLSENSIVALLPPFSGG